MPMIMMILVVTTTISIIIVIPMTVGYVYDKLHPVSITRFPLSRFSPGAGLLRNPFFIGSG